MIHRDQNSKEKQKLGLLNQKKILPLSKDDEDGWMDVRVCSGDRCTDVLFSTHKRACEDINGWLLSCTCIHSIKPIRQQEKKKESCLVMCASNKLKKKKKKKSGAQRFDPNPQQRQRERERELWHSLCHFREASLHWQLHLSSTPAPPHRCGPDERWSWQSWGTKICVMLWLLMPHWQILLRRGSGSRLNMITTVMCQINNFHFQCQ